MEILGVLRNNFLLGLKINFKFEILGILVQNPHSWQALGRERPATYGDFEKKIIRQKSFSDFAENFVMNSSPKIIFFNFGKSAKQLSYGFKNQF